MVYEDKLTAGCCLYLQYTIYRHPAIHKEQQDAYTMKTGSHERTRFFFIILDFTKLVIAQ